MLGLIFDFIGGAANGANDHVQPERTTDSLGAAGWMAREHAWGRPGDSAWWAGYSLAKQERERHDANPRTTGGFRLF